MPVGAYGASAAIMQYISPDGNVYQAGTLSGNPVAMAAGIAQLTELSRSGFYEGLREKTAAFVEDIRNHIAEKGYAMQIVNVGSIFWFAFSTQENIRAAADIDHASMDYYKVFHRELLNRGVYLGPSGYEVGFVSASHTPEILEQVKIAIFDSLAIVFES